MNPRQERPGWIRRAVAVGGILLLLTLLGGLRPAEAVPEGGEHAADDGHGEHESPGLVSFSLPLVAWTWITFGIVLVVLWRKAWTPLLGALDDRAKRIKGDLDRAEQERTKMEELRQSYEQRISQAEQEAARIVADGKADAEKTAHDITDSANREAEQIKVRANREIDQAKARALDEVWKQAADLSTRIASKVLERAISPEDHRRLIDETIEGYKRQMGAA